jgi:hypothetical protein
MTSLPAFPRSNVRSFPLLPVLVILSGLALAGCERGFPTPPAEPTISEDLFVAAMVAILSEAPSHQDSRLPEAERDRILREMGLVPADLVTFAEVHGSDVSYMLSVWTRVDAAFLEALNDAAVEPGGPGGPGGAGGPGGPGVPDADAPGSAEGPGAVDGPGGADGPGSAARPGSPDGPGAPDGPGR